MLLLYLRKTYKLCVSNMNLETLLKDSIMEHIISFVGREGKVRPSEIEKKFCGKFSENPIKHKTYIYRRLKEAERYGIILKIKDEKNKKLTYYILNDEYKLEVLRSLDKILIDGFSRDKILDRTNIPLYEVFNLNLELVEQAIEKLPIDERKEAEKELKTLREEKGFDLTKTLYGFKEEVFTPKEKNELSSKINQLNIEVLKIRKKAYGRLLNKKLRKIKSELNAENLNQTHKKIIAQCLNLFNKEYRKYVLKENTGELLDPNEYSNLKNAFIEKIEKKEINILTPLFKNKTLSEEQIQNLTDKTTEYIKKIITAYEEYLKEVGNYMITIKPLIQPLSEEGVKHLKLILSNQPLP